MYVNKSRQLCLLSITQWGVETRDPSQEHEQESLSKGEALSATVKASIYWEGLEFHVANAFLCVSIKSHEKERSDSFKTAARSL